MERVGFIECVHASTQRDSNVYRVSSSFRIEGERMGAAKTCRYVRNACMRAHSYLLHRPFCLIICASINNSRINTSEELVEFVRGHDSIRKHDGVTKHVGSL